MHDPEFLGKIENALQLQLLLYQSGGPCPEPLTLEGLYAYPAVRKVHDRHDMLPRRYGACWHDRRA
ncbi:hypothetical protein [Paenibacillus zanthoxyli]|uniref:hypothetical protein n=1 Tax=Paenibacillus zanthoxyli TaxID=369399 RepID=UPI00046E6E04|nr:hypothetical protein [Paenibacillus zanthoxyli]